MKQGTIIKRYRVENIRLCFSGRSRAGSLSGCPPVTRPIVGRGLKASPLAALRRLRLSLLAWALPSHLDGAGQLFAFPLAGCCNECHRTCCAGDDGPAPSSRVLRGMPGSSIEPYLFSRLRRILITKPVGSLPRPRCLGNPGKAESG